MKIVLAVLLVAFSLSAKDIYVAQNSAGGDTGAGAADAHSVAWFNTAGNWGSGGTQISPGDKVHLCGTMTSGITIQADGASVSAPTIIYFESGANFTAAFLSGTVVNLGSHNNITVDGGSNGTIQNTANGLGLANTKATVGVSSSGNNITLQNLSILDLFTRIPNDTGNTSGDGNTGISLVNMGYASMSNIIVRNCRLTWCRTAISVVYSGNCTNWQIYSNTILYCADGIFGGGWPSSSTLTNVTIHHNRIDHCEPWDTTSDTYHEDMIYLWGDVAADAIIDNLSIYDNVLGPNFGTYNTALLYLSATGPGSYMYNVKIYNNVFLSPGNNCGNLYLWGVGGLVANNTFIRTSGTGGTAISMRRDTSPDCALLFFNNISYGYPVHYYNYGDSTGIGITAADYNDFYCGTDFGSLGGSLATWRGLGFDVHSITSNPNFVNMNNTNDLQLQAGSPAIGIGTNLSSYFTTDFNGKLRPSTGPWDIGAYQYAAGETNAPGTNAVLHYDLRGITGGGFTL